MPKVDRVEPDRVDELVASTRPEISDGSSNLISSGARVGLATALAGAANYASNIVLGRALDEDAFADAALTVSGLLLFAAIALGFQMTTAKTIASGGGATAIRAALWKARRTGVLVGAALLAAAAPLSDLTGMGSSWPLILLAVSVPLLFDLAVRRGAVQASNRFSTLAFSLLIEGVLRLIMTAVALLAGLSATSAGAGIIVSLIVSSAACGRLNKYAAADGEASESSGGRPVMLLLAGQVVIANGDLWIVSAFLPDEVGSYAGITLFGRLILVLAASVVTVAFPSLVKDGASEGGRLLLRRAVLATAAMAGFFAATVAVLGGPLLRLMLGPDRDGHAQRCERRCVLTGDHATSQNNQRTRQVAHGKN